MPRLDSLLTPDMQEQLADSLDLLELRGATHFLVGRPNKEVNLIYIMPVQIVPSEQQVLWGEGMSESHRADH